jgi:hypothetical protein
MPDDPCPHLYRAGLMELCNLTCSTCTKETTGCYRFPRLGDTRWRGTCTACGHNSWRYEGDNAVCSVCSPVKPVKVKPVNPGPKQGRLF